MMPTDLVAQQPTESGCPEDGGTEADPEELARLSGGHCRADEMLVSDPALGNVSPLSAGEEVKPRNAGHRRQSVTVTGRRLLPKSVTCLQPGSVKIEGVSSGKTESHAHKAEALSGSLQDGRTPTDRGSPPEEKPPAFGDEKPACCPWCQLLAEKATTSRKVSVHETRRGDETPWPRHPLAYHTSHCCRQLGPRWTSAASPPCRTPCSRHRWRPGLRPRDSSAPACQVLRSKAPFSLHHTSVL
nr:T-complex protein 10A homolog 1 isoform X3 [Manis javanica]XP_036876752.1 T-complex protein 10A homolog 1 isoform X3 [Manis javanica]